MAENSKIEWCDDTVSFWWGCTRYGEGCRNCYAERMSKRSGDFWGPQSPRLHIKSAIQECHRLNRKAEREGKRRIVFVNSMSDFFDQHDGPILTRQGKRLYHFEGGYSENSATANIALDAVSLNDLRKDAFATFSECQSLIFLLLTKRPENIGRMWPKTLDVDGEDGNLANVCEPRHNVWLGTSIATQADADRNIPLLLECRELAPVMFLSCEPLVEAVNLRTGIYSMPPDGKRQYGTTLEGIDWAIVGGESGHGARPCHPDWVRSIRDQCKAAGVPFLLKQWGEFAPYGAAGLANGWTRTRVDGDKVYGSLHAHDFAGDKYTETPLFNGRSFETRFINPNHECLVKVGKKAAGRLLDGQEWNEFPQLESAP